MRLTMSNTNFLSKLLMPFGPRLPLEQLTEEVNRLYHAAEAETYDSRHPELFAQLPPIWEEMVQLITKDHPDKRWDILDFGCGTGFASQQILSLMPAKSIRSLTCYDPSPEMLDRCRAKLGTRGTAFLSSPHLLSQVTTRFNLLVTNSLLHHLPNPLAFIKGLSTLLTEDAVWLAGHEPSRRFYQNADCLSVYNAYVRSRKLGKYWNVGAYVRFLQHKLSSPAAYAARRAYRNRLFERKPSASAIDRLVDFHVAHSWDEAMSGRGFNIDEIMEGLKGGWGLAWFKSYSFMGCYSKLDLSKYWVKKSGELADAYPKDGANFCSIWSRTQAGSNPDYLHPVKHGQDMSPLWGRELGDVGGAAMPPPWCEITVIRLCNDRLRWRIYPGE